MLSNKVQKLLMRNQAHIIKNASRTISSKFFKDLLLTLFFIFIDKVTAVEEHSKHRMKLPLYDIEPRTENNWIAPSATVIGEVQLRRFASVWYNAVIRGDINRVYIGHFSSIGENSVLHTAPSLPTGMNAKLHIGRNCTIGSNCTLYSCHIGDDVVIGDKSVILEGAKIESGA